MKLFKRILIVFICLLFAFNGCSLGRFNPAFFVYADSTTNQWESVTSNEELVEAFKYYCKSRSLVIEGSALDAVTSFTTSTFNNLCNTLGFNVTALQANLKKSTDSNGRLQFLFDSTGIAAYNQIFSLFLQNNNLTVGDTVEEQTLYEGRYFTDDQLNSCFVYEVNTTGYTGTPSIKGTPYIYDSKYFESLNSSFNETHSYNNISYTLNFTYNSTQYYRGFTYKVNNSNGNFIFYYNNNSREYDRGNVAVIYNNSDHALYIGMYNYLLGNSQKNVCILMYKLTADSSVIDQNTPITNIYLTTNNSAINNNVYEGDTIIGDDSQSDDPIDPDDPPGGTTTEPITPSNPDGENNLNFPLIDLDLPEINWSLGDLTNKFPFSIPFDLIHLVQVFDAEPVAPRFAGTVNFGFTTWDYDINLEEFDSVAAVCRTATLIGLIATLIFITRNIIKG